MKSKQLGFFRIMAGIGSISVFCLMSYGQEPTAVSVHGRLHIKGNKFVDQYDQPVTLHGMSTYNWAGQGTQYFNTTAITRMAKEWKCTAIRCVLLPGNAGSMTNKVDTVVQACIDNGMYVIINWHSMGGANANDASNWYRGLAARWGKYPNVMYEPWNEPVNETWTYLKGWHEQVIKAIRPIDSVGIIICGNRQWDQRPDEAAKDPITITDNIAYTFHFYAATHPIKNFRGYVQATLDSNLALFATEYGTCESNGSGRMDTAETRKWYNYLDSNGIGCTNWSISALGETSAAFYDGTSATNWTDANIKPSGLFVRAYIQSQYDQTLIVSGVRPEFKIHRSEKVQSLSTGDALFMPGLFKLNGVRVTGALKNARAAGIFVFPPHGTVTAGKSMHIGR